MDSDLECLIRDRATIISPADVKSYMQMVLQSLLALQAALGAAQGHQAQQLPHLHARCVMCSQVM